MKTRFVGIMTNYTQKNNIALRLYKDAFVEGSWEECKKKINDMLK